MTGKMIRKAVSFTLALVCLNVTAGAADGDFYRGKTVRIQIGASAGGAFDTWGRITGRHLGKHIPGNPVVVAENVTGAGGLILANQVYKSVRPDGLTLATFSGGLLMLQVLGRPGVEFDGRKFEYLGVPTKFDSVCAFTKASGITSFDAWRNAKTPVKVGGTAPGSNLVDIPKILMAVYRLPTQIIIGYKGFAEIRLAADAGELAGACGGWDGLKLLWGKQIEAGEVSVVLQTKTPPLADLPKVPYILDWASNDEDRQLIEAGVQFPALISLAYALPPATPQERVLVMRKALMDTWTSSDFLADVQRARLVAEPASGAELKRIVDRLFALKPAVANRLKETLK